MTSSQVIIIIANHLLLPSSLHPSLSQVRAVQLRPELPIHHKNIAQIYSIRGDTESALKHNRGE